MVEYINSLERSFAVMPENLRTLEIFLAVSTQWRVSMSGAYGLDYNSLFEVFSIYDIKKEDRAEIFSGIRVMEAAVLQTLKKK